jgi:broad specificity phosphatase PhoE
MITEILREAQVLVLVRHAMPVVARSQPPAQWILSAEGRTAAARMSLPEHAYLVASDEPKAFQTLEPFGTVERDGRFGEVRRTGEPWDGYRDVRRSYVAGVDHDGWEARGAVVARFDAAVRDHLVRAHGRAIVVATHGMAMTLWLAATVGLPSPAEFWDDLRLPDPFTVDLAAHTVSRLEPPPAPPRRRS